MYLSLRTEIVAAILWLHISTVNISPAIDLKLPGGLLNPFNHIYSKTNTFSMMAWTVIVVQSAVVRSSRQGNEGDSWKLLFNTVGSTEQKCLSLSWLVRKVR